ncbi:MAG TPA: tetratricopeptide repeat protein [Planctomycetota bacterium]|nr:tetratricopeptide repeat protein [Planctomycetota bacterium]
MIDASRRLRAWAVPLVPFAFSLALSIPTLGSTVFWQDSGLYLTSVHELSVPPPHGFVLYLLVAKLWTLALAPLAGFTLAAHLFSAVCAAGAAAFLALACRAFLRRFRPDAPAEGPAIAAALIAAAGYSFWNSALLAKPYALYYLLLSLLLWILIRAERRGEFLALGLVLGLAWAAHPSAAMLVPAMLAYAWARRDKVRGLRAPGFAAVVLIAAAAAFLPSFVVLPLLAKRGSLCSFGDPRTIPQVWSHLRAANYTDFRGAWGFDLGRAGLAARFIWEEFLGVGLAVLGLGVWRLAKERPPVLGLIAAWAGPMLLLPFVFLGEGMFDQWFVAAYIPLSLCTAAGFAWILDRVRVAAPGVLATAVAWMILANFADLSNRHYGEAESYGRILLDSVPPGGVLVASTDEATFIPMYLQQVQGWRTDVRLVHGEFLGAGWYDARLERAFGMRPPDAAEIATRTNPQLLGLTAFANANVRPGKPVYSERPTDPNGLRPGLALVPAGVLWKTAVAAEATPEPFRPALDPSLLAGRRRRARGIHMRHLSTGMVARYEPYEDRLIDLLMQPKLRDVKALLEKNPAAALQLYEHARSIDAALEVDPAFQYDYALSLYLCDRPADAEKSFERVLMLEPSPARETLSHFYLAEIARGANRRDDAKRHYERALQRNGADEVMMMKIRARASQP